jgi:hypothetical protein
MVRPLLSSTDRVLSSVTSTRSAVAVRELARFARALHTAIKKGRGDPTFSPREKVPRRGG